MEQTMPQTTRKAGITAAMLLSLGGGEERMRNVSDFSPDGVVLCFLTLLVRLVTGKAFRL